VQKIEDAISKRDTSQIVVVPEKQVDSFSIVKNIISNLNKVQRINFTTFSAKIKIDYEGNDGSDDLTAYMRIQKDSIIWVSIRGMLDIEGARLEIDKKHVKLMNMLKKTVQYRNISYLQELTHVPLDFYGLQDLLLGNPVFIDSNIVSYKSTGNQLLVLMVGKLFKNLLTLDNNNFQMLHSKLDDTDPSRNRTCDITYGNYEKVKDFYFSTERKISVAEQSKLDVDMQFKKYSFDEPETFPFVIPKNYKVL
jgi:hypothetical protein